MWLTFGEIIVALSIQMCVWVHERVPYLALLVAVGQDLQAVSGDGEELDVGLAEQGHHLLQAPGQAHSHLGPFLVQQQVVERGDSVEEHRVHWRPTHTHREADREADRHRQMDTRLMNQESKATTSQSPSLPLCIASEVL